MLGGVHVINVLPLSPFQFLVFFFSSNRGSERKRGAVLAWSAVEADKNGRDLIFFWFLLLEFFGSV